MEIFSAVEPAIMRTAPWHVPSPFHVLGGYCAQLRPKRRTRSWRNLEPVTNQVTTTTGNDRRSATNPDAGMLLTCGNPTQFDGIRRNRNAW